MNVKDLVNEVADILELPKYGNEGKKALSHQIFTTILRTIVEALHRGESVRIMGLGTFSVRTRPAYNQPCCYFLKANHWEVRKIPAEKYVSFTPSKSILRSLNA